MLARSILYAAIISALPTVAFMAATPASAQSATDQGCANATSTVAIQDCQQQQLKAANDALNQAYQKRLTSLPSAQRTQLRTEERAWMRQRDRTCAVKSDSGTSGTLDTAQCLLQQTRDRTSVLQSGQQ